MKLTLRFFTVVCYFLPFTFFLTTCNNGSELRIAYNKAEAEKNILLENDSSMAVADPTQYEQHVSTDTVKKDTVTPNILQNTEKKPSGTLRKSSDFGDKILRRIIMPTDTSLSGVGSVLYFKNLTGKIALAISLLISLILFIALKFLKSKRTRLYLLSIAVLSLIIFIIDSFVSSVTLLWGSWTLLILLLLELIWEFNDKTTAYR